MSAITAKASRKMKKYAVLTREPRCFLGSFDFSWEQRKLGDIASDMVAGGDIDKDLILAEGQYPVIANALTGDGIVGYYDKEYRVNAPAVTVTGRGDVGHAKARLVNFTPVVRLLSVKSEHDVFFLENAINTLKIVIESTGVPQLTVPQLAKYEVAFPRQLDEEEHIGAFFKQLDHLITLHQRKCANLCSPSQVVFSLLFATSTFSWEQRKLGDVVQITMGQSPDGSTYSDEPSDYILVQGNADLQNGWVCPRIWTTQITKKADAGDLIMSVRAPAGAMGKTAYNAVIGRGVAAIKGNEFIYQLLVKMDADGFWKTLSCGSTFESLNSDNIKNAEVKIPTTAEQIKIGGYFQQLDNLITLHQRECISFTGRADRLILTANKKRTTSSWEQRKLSEITDKVTEKNAGLQYVETFTNSAEFGIISQRDFFDHDIAKLGSLDGYYIVKNEDFVYNPRISTSAPVGPINRNKLGRTGVMSPLYTVFRPHDIDTTYLEYFFKCGYWHSFMNFNGDSGARSDRFSIRDNVFFQMPIPIPDIDEQRKIGELLTCLDNLITLHQRKPFLMKWRTSDANRNQTNRLVL